MALVDYVKMPMIPGTGALVLVKCGNCRTGVRSAHITTGTPAHGAPQVSNTATCMPCRGGGGGAAWNRVGAPTGGSMDQWRTEWAGANWERGSAGEMSRSPEAVQAGLAEPLGALWAPELTALL